MAKRKKYSEEFKREAVGLTRQPGASVSQIAQDIGVNANQLCRWRVELESSGKKAFPGAGVARDQG
jgi:transposase